MINNLVQELSPGARKMIKEMTPQELESFTEQGIGIVVKMKPFSEPLEVVVDRVIAQEAEKLYQNSSAFKEMMEARGRINVDWESRLKTPRSSSGESGDPSAELARLAKQIMVENPTFSYSQALNEAQRQRKDLAKRILAQLDEARRTATRGGF